MSDATVPDTRPARIDPVAALDEIFKDVDRSDAPGLVVGVAHHGRPLYRRGFGLASIEHGVANTPWTRMRIGSTSKHFACLAALLLVEEGRLDIDAGVSRYLPELPPTTPEPTLRQFMHHTSGLRDFLDASFLASGLSIRPRGEALAMQLRQSETNFAAGEKMTYNNGGYHLLSLVIERVGGMPFEEFLASRIFEPLGMVDTRSIPSDLEIHRGLATLHVPQPDGTYRRGLFPNEEVRGEGGMVSTIDDMLRWLENLRGTRRQVGSDASWAQMVEPARLNNGLVSAYAMGLMVERYRGVDVLHHGGTVIGGTCQMLTLPAHELDIVIIANGAPVSVGELANKVVDAVLGDSALGPRDEVPAQAADHRALLDARYHSAATGLVLGFGDVAGKLGLVIHNSPPIPLREDAGQLCLDFSRVAAGPFRVDAPRRPEGDAAPQMLHASEGGNQVLLERLPTTAPEPAALLAALGGDYRAPDLAATARLALEGEQLVMRITSAFGSNALTLQPLSDDVIAWKFQGQLAALGGTFTIERERGAVSGLRASTLRTRHVLFERVSA
jgi:CubicO group peptidase (beta-lactamase class C family)